MPFTQRILIVAVGTAALVFSAAAARAHVYNDRSGNAFSAASRSFAGTWPVTITNSQYSNGTDCLTLSGNGKSGSATLVAGSQKYPYGSFLVLHGIIIVNIVEPLYGQNGVLTFTAHANNGHIGQGIFEDLRGGSNFDNGDLSFGTKNGC